MVCNRLSRRSYQGSPSTPGRSGSSVLVARDVELNHGVHRTLDPAAGSWARIVPVGLCPLGVLVEVVVPPAESPAADNSGSACSSAVQPRWARQPVPRSLGGRHWANRSGPQSLSQWSEWGRWWSSPVGSAMHRCFEDCHFLRLQNSETKPRISTAAAVPSTMSDRRTIHQFVSTSSLSHST